MNDRELLELAAKAYIAANYKAGEYKTPDDAAADLCPGGKQWNPLTDDGDALRLAVKLGLQITVCRNDKTFVEGDHAFAEEDHGDDSMDATRRAVVRAAATLAKGEGKV